MLNNSWYSVVTTTPSCIQDDSEIDGPLYNPTKRLARFLWTAGCQAVFDTPRQKLVEPPILAHPVSLSSILQTDISGRTHH